MNLSQTKLIGLTMDLNLKAIEFNKLCDVLEKAKQNNIDPNDEKLIFLKEMFLRNYNEIVELNEQIDKLKGDFLIL